MFFFFFNRGIFVVDMLSYSIMNEACSATKILLIAPATRKLVHFISSIRRHNSVLDGWGICL